MTVSNAIVGRASDGRTRNGPLAAYVRPRPHSREDDDNPPDERLAKGLGWFSIGLGLAQVLAPRGFARSIGLEGDGSNCAVVRLVGLRELACGIGILSRRRPAGWVWARVAGDMMDIALLGTALASDPPRRDRVVAATAAVLGVTALDLYEGVQLGSPTDGRGLREIHVKKAITVNRSPEDVYRFWHDLRNLPRFMDHLESVEVTGDRRSHWRARGPAGSSIEWDAETVEDRPNELIAWRSVPGAQVDNAGSVRFVPAPGGRGTEIHVDLRYSPPGGVIGAAIAGLFGESPDQQVGDDLRAFKQIIETGEIIRSDATVGGGRYRQRPAQPPAQLQSGRPGR